MIGLAGMRLAYSAVALCVAAGLIALAVVPGRMSGFTDNFPICAAARSSNSDESMFLAATATLMSNMMQDMTIEPSGDVDRDFVSIMVPHHQGAVDMAQAELRYGRNERLKRMAQEIIVTQQQEIVVMHMTVGKTPPRSVAPSRQGVSTEPIISKSLATGRYSQGATQ